MAKLDHDAILKAYPEVDIISDDTGAFKADGTKVTLVQSDIDAARTALDKEFADNKYQRDRAAEYPDWKSQLDYIFHNGLAKWKTDIVQPVKDKYPKP
tara:strand:+ start:648 stop:941 length:294 start_codon:yes stop_codon:yes gene_type:complete